MNDEELLVAARRVAIARGKPDHFECLVREIVDLARRYSINIPPRPEDIPAFRPVIRLKPRKVGK